jgi:hypothetical protein
MPVDKELEFRKLRIGIKKAVLDRQQGSWSRALWYGGQSLPARGAAFVAGKAMSAPGTAAGTVVKFAATPVLTPIGGAAAGYLAGKLVDAALPRVIDKVKDRSRWLRGLDQGMDATTSFNKEFTTLKEDAIPTIDRNVRKLDDAVRDANKAAEDLRLSAAKPAQNIDLDELGTRSEAALRAAYEVGYYHAKVTALVETLAAAVQSLSDELKKMDDPIARCTEGVETTAKEVLGNCLATAEFHAGQGPRVAPPLPPKPNLASGRVGPPPLPPKPGR